jgi:hypothetical protein
MFESTLYSLIPKEVNTFAKLDHGAPYHFDCWKNDRVGSPCLYYWFMARDGVKKNKKRLPVSEIRAALRQLRGAGVLSREMFRKVCPTAKSDGECGYAVVGRILEALHVAIYSGNDGFKLTNPDEATSLIGAKPASGGGSGTLPRASQ